MCHGIVDNMRGVTSQYNPADGLPAIVVFADDTSLIWLRLFRRGFRHCFVAVQRNNVWIICNSLSHYTDLDAAVGWPAGELSTWYRSRGFIVVEAVARVPPQRCAPVRPFTCVETVKRVLGLRAPGVFTPWQLYRFLCGTVGDAEHKGINS